MNDSIKTETLAQHPFFQFPQKSLPRKSSVRGHPPSVLQLNSKTLPLTLHITMARPDATNYLDAPKENPQRKSKPRSLTWKAQSRVKIKTPL